MGRKLNLKDRELEYWITKHMPRNHCWIIIANIDRIIGHEDKEIKSTVLKGDLPLNSQTLQYVYFALMDEKQLTTLVRDNEYFYIIRNEQKSQQELELEKLKIKREINERREQGESVDDQTHNQITSRQIEPVSSKIWVEDSIESALAHLTKDEYSKTGLKKMKLNQPDRNTLSSIIAVDFINKDKDEQIKLWRQKLTNHTDETLDLSGFQFLDPEVANSLLEVNQKIEKLILYQNNRLVDFHWLNKLPNVKTISIWFSNQLLDENLQSLNDNAKKLEHIELHYCYQITGRCIIPLSLSESIKDLIIDNPVCKCQETTFATVIKPEEWEQISNDKLELLLINSDNLTPDFTYYLLNNFSNLKRIIVSDAALTKLHGCTVSGYEKETIIFQSFQNKSRGFKLNKEVKFRNLLKDQTDVNQYSESMLNIIKEKNPLEYKRIMHIMATKKEKK